MQGIRYIEPKINVDAQLKIRSFYYSNTLSVSVSDEIKEDASLIKDCVLFYFLLDDVLLETLPLPISALLDTDEVWMSPKAVVRGTELYVTDIFDRYSYHLMFPF